MNSLRIQEPQALLEVREWKERAYQATKDLTHQAYLQRLDTISEQVKQQYHLHLRKVTRLPIMQRSMARQ